MSEFKYKDNSLLIRLTNTNDVTRVPFFLRQLVEQHPELVTGSNEIELILYGHGIETVFRMLHMLKIKVHSLILNDIKFDSSDPQSFDLLDNYTHPIKLLSIDQSFRVQVLGDIPMWNCFNQLEEIICRDTNILHFVYFCKESYRFLFLKKLVFVFTSDILDESETLQKWSLRQQKPIISKNAITFLL